MEEIEITIDFKMDLKVVKHDLLKGIHECSQRGLNQTTKWLAELNHSIVDVQLPPESFPNIVYGCEEETDVFLLAKSYFDIKEYDRCSYFTRKCKKPKTQFLHYYATFLSIEKKRLDNMTDDNCPPDPTKNEALTTLCTTLKNKYFCDELDGYCLYLFGVVLRKLDLIPLAVETFIKAVTKEPTLWAAWQELGQTVADKHGLDIAELPDHWMKRFFLAHTALEQLNNDDAMDMYCCLREQGFSKSSYLLAQTAIAHHNRRELDKAIEVFKQLLIIDPYRLDNLDTYSNLLYVKELNTQLADLAHKAVSIDKYRVETCCVIGNYYSLRSDHAKAVLYFRRALKLNPNYLSAWTLMGHEFMEMKNSNAAIQSYRHAIEINSRDYRAWYGLGQTYEILKMPFYCLYYYKKAQQLRPNDSRMIIALGETYEKLEKSENALKCYYKACNMGDVEGFALIKLAKLYDKVKDADNAAAAFTDYCLRMDEQSEKTHEEEVEFYNAFLYLANYHIKKGQYDDAYSYAFKCLEFDETKEQGKALLKQIAATRGKLNMSSVMDETEPSISQIVNEATSTSNMEIISLDELGGC